MAPHFHHGSIGLHTLPHTSLPGVNCVGTSSSVWNCSMGCSTVKNYQLQSKNTYTSQRPWHLKHLSHTYTHTHTHIHTTHTRTHTHTFTHTHTHTHIHTHTHTHTHTHIHTHTHTNTQTTLTLKHMPMHALIELHAYKNRPACKQHLIAART